MKWDAIKPWISKLAPMLGASIGGPLGLGVGKIIGDALGVKDATPESIHAAVSSGALTGEQLVALKAAEQHHAEQMALLGYTSAAELEGLAVEDRKDARGREVALKDWTPRILAYGVTLGFFGLLAALMRWGLPEGSRDVVTLMLGSLGTAWVSIVSYYFGSSASSAHKDTLLNRGK